MSDIAITQLDQSPETIMQLAALLVETVAHGGSVSFMHPLAPEAARAFWDSALASAGRGQRVVFGAWHGNSLIGTLSLVTALPENQPHRAEIAKMMVAVRHRGQGIASALLRAAEAEAARLGRTHLMLDTASDGGAAGLYERHGFIFAGEIPDFALKPQGGLTGTRLYWKRI
ncbi:GNAT family N-acetyltransferase [Acidisoma silvae]|uniref:GNAT family N-acetyltransferase n=1 Tax=Acidisoma silvae TaxID=2802396 RepID=A0A964DZ64_9PROT|nr:GNAT family N-acetyltransferase [Acidisoma silvae]MCB8876150.1 GNAT family N-acetyltransferase [Acidisoma silvae]